MYYKVTTPDLKSINPILPKDELIQYKLRSKVYPKYSFAPLCVFNDLSLAENFVKTNNFPSRIFECAIKKSDKQWGRAKFIDIHRIFLPDFDYTSITWPVGTVLADEVALIKEVTETDKKPKIYYKVIGENLVSYSIESRELNLDIKYKIDEWVLPKREYAPLMTFPDFRSAQQFQLRFAQAASIYKCEIIKSKRKWGYIGQKYLESLNKIDRCKKNKKKLDRDILTNDLPYNTIFADAVKLIEVATA